MLVLLRGYESVNGGGGGDAQTTPRRAIGLPAHCTATGHSWGHPLGVVLRKLVLPTTSNLQRSARLRVFGAGLSIPEPLPARIGPLLGVAWSHHRSEKSRSFAVVAGLRHLPRDVPSHPGREDLRRILGGQLRSPPAADLPSPVHGVGVSDQPNLGLLRRPVRLREPCDGPAVGIRPGPRCSSILSNRDGQVRTPVASSCACPEVGNGPKERHARVLPGLGSILVLGVRSGTLLHLRPLSRSDYRRAAIVGCHRGWPQHSCRRPVVRPNLALLPDAARPRCEGCREQGNATDRQERLDSHDRCGADSFQPVLPDGLPIHRQPLTLERHDVRGTLPAGVGRCHCRGRGIIGPPSPREPPTGGASACREPSDGQGVV